MTRLRITAAFLLAAAVGLCAVGFVVHTALRDRLDDALDEALEDRGTAIARLVVQRGAVQPGVTQGLDDPGESFTQVIGPDGRLRASTPGLPLRPVLPRSRWRRAAGGGLDVRLQGVDVEAVDEGPDEIDVDALEETGAEPFETDRARVRAAQVTLDDGTYTILTGATYEDRDEALSELRGVLWLGGPLALILVGLAGFLAVGRALRPLHAALAHEQRLVADVSHELRTPLAIASGELELALDPAAPEAERTASVEVAADEVRRLARMADDLLLLARSDERGLDLRREPVDVADLLRDTARRFAVRTELSVEAEPGLVISADRPRLEQLLGNLVENALAHGAPPVELSAATDGEGVVVVVRDHGPGIPAAVLPRAFERFSRGREGRTGLGLAIVEVVARAHGGTASAANAGGTEVRVRLPRS